MSDLILPQKKVKGDGYSRLYENTQEKNNPHTNEINGKNIIRKNIIRKI